MQFQQLSKEAILPLACNVFAGVTAFYCDAQIKHTVFLIHLSIARVLILEYFFLILMNN